MSRPRISRRGFLGISAASTGAVLLGTGSWSASAAYAAPAGLGHPFTLGVASGDPTHDGVVLWTRLAPDPFAADGRGGMPAAPVRVQYEVAMDDRFRAVVRRGSVVATPELGHSVHPEVSGLAPGREYFYRFRVGTEVSAVGRTRTPSRAASGSRSRPARPGRTATTRRTSTWRTRTSTSSCTWATTSTSTAWAPTSAA